MVRRFIFDNYKAFNGIIELKELIKVNEKDEKKKQQTLNILKETFNEMNQDKTLFDYTMLNISGKQLIKYFPKIKLDLLNEFMFDIAGKLAENSGMKNIEENIVLMGKKVLSERKEYYCEDEIEVATYKTDSKLKVFNKKLLKKLKSFFSSIFFKIKCIWIALFKTNQKKNKEK